MPNLSHVVAPFVESNDFEYEIIIRVENQHAVTLDALIAQMPQYSWNQVFQAVDMLARCGKISLRRHGFGYTVFSQHYVA